MNDGIFPFGYCTNVHAGVRLESAKSNLLKYACSVRQQVIPDGRLPVGLWLADAAVEELVSEDACERFRDWLAEKRLIPYTFNGFPQRDFHQPIVKHAVYEPSWLDDSRRQYTIDLANILSRLLMVGSVGSISTLPLGWPSHGDWKPEQLSHAANQLRSVAQQLHQLFETHGRQIVLAIEPEPGCVLDSVGDIVEFFNRYLFQGNDQSICRRHLTVCHDICHSAVMFEPQVAVLQTYQQHGIRVGKVQVSSAIEVPWKECLQQPEKYTVARIREQLMNLHEPRYLHQTTRADSSGRLASLVEDLPLALAKWEAPTPETNWRIHFHVPIFVNQFGCLSATGSDIASACRFLEMYGRHDIDGAPWFTGHYEVETYAWPVLPRELQCDDLASGIAQELVHLQTTFEDF